MHHGRIGVGRFDLIECPLDRRIVTNDARGAYPAIRPAFDIEEAYPLIRMRRG